MASRKAKRKARGHSSNTRRIARTMPHIMLPSPTYCHQTPPQPGNAPSPPLNPPLNNLGS